MTADPSAPLRRAVHGVPANALENALKTLSKLAFWISWTSDPDLYPDARTSARCLRDAATGLRNTAKHLCEAADVLDPPTPRADPLSTTREPS